MVDLSKPQLKSRELAELFGVDQAYVLDVTRQGVLKKDAKGGYETEETIRRFVGHLRGVAKAGVGAEARDELTKSKAALAAIELAERQGVLVQVDRVVEHLSNGFANVRARLLGIPTKLAPIVATKSNPAHVQEIIAREIEDALAELARLDPLPPPGPPLRNRGGRPRKSV